MANVVPNAFKGELLSGTHNFAAGGDGFKLALYTANPYTTSSTVYSSGAGNEVSGSAPGYSTGGSALTSQAVASSTATASVDFANLTFQAQLFLLRLEQFIMMINLIN